MTSQTPPCAPWIKDFFTLRVIKRPHLSSSSIILSTSGHQGCVLSPALYFLYIHDCIPVHLSNIIIKLADNTTVIGLITGGDESAQRDGIKKTVSVSTGIWRKWVTVLALFSTGRCVERVQAFKVSGVVVSEDLSWSASTIRIINSTLSSWVCPGDATQRGKASGGLLLGGH